jgi:flagellar hook protein FlgE
VLLDGENQTGETDWTQHVMTLTINGTGPDTVTTSAEVFDNSGNGHQLSFTYERQEDGTWDLQVDLPASEGTVLNGSVTGIQFNEDGSILTPPSGTVQVQFAGQSSQNVALDFGSPGSFAGLTQFGGSPSVVIEEQDGYGAGELSSMQVHDDGEIEGYYNNGQVAVLGRFGVATFANSLGLQEVGDSMWGETPNSGARVFGGGSVGVAGQIVGGALEESNVDTAEQFVRLIQAQRGFQSNARVVTVQDEMMSEANNML